MKKLLAILAVLSLVVFAAAGGTGDVSNGFLVKTSDADRAEYILQVRCEDNATVTTGDAEYAGNGCVDGSDDSCDSAQGNQKTLAVVIDGDDTVTDGDSHGDLVV